MIDSALSYSGFAEGLLDKYGTESNQLSAYATMGNNYRAKKKYDTALKYLNRGLSIAEKYKAPRWLCTYYYNLADTYEQMGDYKKANYYNQINIRMHNQLVTQENFIAATDFQNRFERAKKDNAILKLGAENKQRSLINKILIGATVSLILISLLVYMNFRKNRQLSIQQQHLQQQKIRQLEKDRQFIAIDAMLKGQEEERGRIAKDLHDGLGGLLSGARFSFTDLRDTIGLQGEKAVRFDKSLNILNSTITDLRKIAQNLMPETLVKFGLAEALKDFCDTIQTASNTKIVYQHLGEKRSADSTAEIFAYRIAQELVNNAIKYANASEIFVELLIRPNTINITVEDNGNGFERNNKEVYTGAGMKNIQYRVDYFNGSFDIDTAPGKGPAVYIQLNM
jgi:two-component system, NarL family, sensor kinase